MSTLGHRPGLAPVIMGVREVVARREPPAETVAAVVGVLRRESPGPEILSVRERAGDPERYVTHVLHAEPDGAFSIVAVVWLPGQITPVHDHLAWCAFGVIQGVEHEELFRLDGERLLPVGAAANRAGEVSGFAPPGDIHRVRNAGEGVAISLHVYGADVTATGGSVRRVYRLPIAGG